METQVAKTHNKLATIIKQRETNAFRFKPNKAFFSEIGISQKRFGQLIRNEKEALPSELKAIADYFKVAITDLISI